jgi:inner membrane protein
MTLTVSKSSHLLQLVVKLTSSWLEKNFGHRTLTHSLIGMAILCLLMTPLYLYYPAYFWAILGGYWSHLWIDMLNVRGVDLFWPAQYRVVMPGNQKYRMQVGSKAEMVLMCSIFVMCIGLYPLSDMGLRGGLHQLLRNFDMAHDEFVKKAGTQWFQLDLEAIDNLTLEHIQCDCQVLGTYRSGLIVKHNGIPRAVGEGQSYNLYPKSAVLLEGEPLNVQTYRVDMTRHSLRWLLNNIDSSREYYLLGELYIDAKHYVDVTDIDIYKPVKWQGKRLVLHYARAQELKSYLHHTAIRGEIIIQFWQKPGDSPVEFSLREDIGKDQIPEALEALFDL